MCEIIEKKIAVMQPYFFPYIGYFQLLHAVDCFVVYDDVNYIKQGWVNRNRILVNDHPIMVTLPLQKSSSFKKINEIKRVRDSKWERKFRSTLMHAYSGAPHLDVVLNLVTEIVSQDVDYLGCFLSCQLQMIADYLGLKTVIIPSSVKYQNETLGRVDRLVDICHKEKANHYINALGGQELYKKEDFEVNDIKLSFLNPSINQYRQTSKTKVFVPGLSIIDVMMHVSPERIVEMLEGYTLV